MDVAFLQARITATEAQIVAYEDAITALVSTGIQQYTIDTGQTRQVVTRLDVVRLNKDLDALYNRLVILTARLSGGNVSTQVPGW